MSFTPPSFPASNITLYLGWALVAFLPASGLLVFGAPFSFAVGFAGTTLAVQFLLLRSERGRWRADVRALAEMRREAIHLRRIAQQNKMVLNAVGEGIMGLDPEHRVTFFNTAAERLTGRKERECVGLHRDQILGNSGIFFYGRKRTVVSEGMLPRLAGDPIPVEFRFSPVYEDKLPAGSILMFRDMREHRRANETRQLAATVLEWSAQAIVVTDLAGIIITINPAFSKLTGFLPQDTLGRHISILRSDRHEDEFYTSQWELLHKDGAWGGEMWNRRQDGSLFPAWVNLTRISDKGDDTGFLVGFYFDITERINHEQRLVHAAHHDTLTALPNRRLFLQYLQEAIDAAGNQRGFSLMLIDLDGFKEVNDQHGHAAGDLTLRTVAGRMSRLLRGHDIVARLGGDEFTVLLPNTALEMATAVAEKLMEAISAPISNAGVNLRVSASIGIAGYPDDGDTADALMGAADTAMYAVKRNGKSGVLLFNSQLKETAARLPDWKHLLEEAFHHEEIETLYTPMVDLDTFCVTGFEAGCFWRRADGARVDGKRLSAIIHEAGLSRQLTRLVIRRAAVLLEQFGEKPCRAGGKDAAPDAARDKRGVPPFTVSINLTATDLEAQGGFDSKLHSKQDREDTQTASRQYKEDGEMLCSVADEGIALKANWKQPDIQDGALEINIPETLVARPETEAFIRDLAPLGIAFSIVDFTGYQVGLNTIQALRPRHIKLAPSFMDAFFSGERDARERLASLLALNPGLGVNIVATGVRTPAQLQSVCCAEFHFMEGPIISQALCADDIASFLQNFNQIFSLEITRDATPSSPRTPQP